MKTYYAEVAGKRDPEVEDMDNDITAVAHFQRVWGSALRYVHRENPPLDDSAVGEVTNIYDHLGR